MMSVDETLMCSFQVGFHHYFSGILVIPSPMSTWHVHSNQRTIYFTALSYHSLGVIIYVGCILSSLQDLCYLLTFPLLLCRKWGFLSSLSLLWSTLCRFCPSSVFSPTSLPFFVSSTCALSLALEILKPRFLFGGLIYPRKSMKAE